LEIWTHVYILRVDEYLDSYVRNVLNRIF
jgi:hypothetical protein